MSATIELFWRPGCSSCLRLKEYMAGTGLEYEEVNVLDHPTRAEKLTQKGLFTPAVCVGTECVSGTGLDAVAALIGVTFDDKPLLSPPELKERYDTMLDAAMRFIAQMDSEALAQPQPGRERPMFDVASQTVSVIRGFLAAYYEGVHDRQFAKRPADVQTGEDLLRRAEETRELVRTWWEHHGCDDPLDRVVDTPWWGHRTLHEIFDREVWHTAQHTRQLMNAVEANGIAPDVPLTEDDLAGLQLPEGIEG
jgi:glutaredoxin